MSKSWTILKHIVRSFYIVLTEIHFLLNITSLIKPPTASDGLSSSSNVLSWSQYLVNGVEKQVPLSLDKAPVSQQSSQSLPQATLRMPNKSKIFNNSQYKAEGGKKLNSPIEKRTKEMKIVPVKKKKNKKQWPQNSQSSLKIKEMQIATIPRHCFPP